MGSTNSVPVVSQAKSLVLAIAGKNDEALKVQMDFVHECPIASQVTSAVYMAKNKPEKALETQKRCGKGLVAIVDGIPVVGHIKGGVHYALGQDDEGAACMKAASRTVLVVGGGIGGAVLLGPVGAVSGAIAAGSALDATVTVIDSEIKKQYTPYGVCAAVHECIKAPTVENIFEATVGVVMDGVTGAIAASSVSQPAKMSRSQWRNWQRRAARARNAGRPAVPKPVGTAWKVRKVALVVGDRKEKKKENKEDDSSDNDSAGDDDGEYKNTDNMKCGLRRSQSCDSLGSSLIHCSAFTSLADLSSLEFEAGWENEMVAKL